MEFETVRFNELKRYLKTISDKTLSTNLKELEVALADRLDAGSILWDQNATFINRATQHRITASGT